MTLAPDFTCGYDSQITVPAGTNVTIHGNGAVLDAAKKGRFFTVPSGAALALDASPGVAEWFCFRRQWGAIFNEGDLTVGYSSFISSAANQVHIVPSCVFQPFPALTPAPGI